MSGDIDTSRLRQISKAVSGDNDPKEDLERFFDIQWLMPSIDVEKTLNRLGLEVTDRVGRQVYSYCPDHHLFVDREPSHPKWAVDIDSGKTMCFTEGRGSNLFFTVRRIFKDKGIPHSAMEVVAFLTDSDVFDDIEKMFIAAMPRKLRKMISDSFNDDSPEKEVISGDLAMMQALLENRFTPDRLYDYFMNPPGKSPTNIGREMVDKYRCFLSSSGFYAERAIIPYFLNGEMVSFAAIDILGKEAWLKEHPLASPGDYRKTRFPPGFKSKEYLFNIDNVTEGCELLFLTEGPRECMKLDQEGFHDVSAINGAYLSGEKLVLLASKMPKKVAVMMDGDEAGDRIADSVLGMVSEIFPESFKVRPPDGMDPKNLCRDEILDILRKSGGVS